MSIKVIFEFKKKYQKLVHPIPFLSNFNQIGNFRHFSISFRFDLTSTYISIHTLLYFIQILQLQEISPCNFTCTNVFL